MRNKSRARESSTLTHRPDSLRACRAGDGDGRRQGGRARKKMMGIVVGERKMLVGSTRRKCTNGGQNAASAGFEPRETRDASRPATTAKTTDEENGAKPQRRAA